MYKPSGFRFIAVETNTSNEEQKICCKRSTDQRSEFHSFSKPMLLQREPFLKMFYTINSSPLHDTKYVFMLNNYFEYFPIVSSVFSSVRVKCSLMYIYSHLSCFCFSGDGDHFQGWHCHFATQLRRSVETGHGRNAKGKLHLSITFIGSVDLRTKEALKQMVLFAERCRLIFQA